MSYGVDDLQGVVDRALLTGNCPDLADRVERNELAKFADGLLFANYVGCS